MYDLDKTQEWLNRTIQLNKGPAVRGGVSGEPHARRHTVASVLVALTVILAGMLVISLSRGAGGGPESNVVSVEGGARVASAPPAPPPTLHSPPPVVRQNSALIQSTSGWPALSLDGEVTPLPGHTAPPAPIWLDGPILRR